VTSKVSGSAQALNDKPRFLDVSLAEATKVLGSNTLTAKLSTNIALSGGTGGANAVATTIIVSNLGSVSGDSSQSGCLFVKTQYDFYPVCRCTQIEGDICESCDEDRFKFFEQKLLVWIPDLEHPQLHNPSKYFREGSVEGLCQWAQDRDGAGTFSISLVSGQNIAAGQDFQFSFKVVSQTSTGGSKPTITLHTPSLTLKAQVANKVLEGAQLPILVRAEMTIDSLVQADVSELRINLQPNIIFVSTKPPGTTLVIQMPKESWSTETGPIQLSGKDADSVSKNAMGYWYRETGTLELYGAVLIGPVEFSLRLAARRSSSIGGVLVNPPMPLATVKISNRETLLPVTPLHLQITGQLQSITNQQTFVTDVPSFTQAQAYQVSLSLFLSLTHSLSFLQNLLSDTCDSPL